MSRALLTSTRPASREERQYLVMPLLRGETLQMTLRHCSARPIPGARERC